MLLSHTLDGASQTLAPVSVKIDKTNRNSACIAIDLFRLDGDATFLLQIDRQHERGVGGLLVGKVDESATDIKLKRRTRALWSPRW